jgi:hypothetical protein
MESGPKFTDEGQSGVASNAACERRPEKRSPNSHRNGSVASILTAVVAGIALSACSYLKTPVDPDRVTGLDGSISVQRLRGEFPPVLPSAVTFASAYQTAIAAPSDSSKAKLFAQAGIALSDELCATWFEALERARVNDSFRKDLITNTGALAAVLLELARAGSGPITGAAAGATFLANTVDSHLANFVVAPDLGVVKDAVDKSRAVRAAEIETATLDFYRAYSAVVRYDYSCSHSELKRIVNASVKKVGEETIPKKDEAASKPETAPATATSRPQPSFAAPLRATRSGTRFSAAPSAGSTPTVKELVPGLSPPIR